MWYKQDVVNYLLRRTYSKRGCVGTCMNDIIYVGVRSIYGQLHKTAIETINNGIYLLDIQQIHSQMFNSTTA